MRVLTACLLGALGLVAVSMAACTDATDIDATGGAGGASAGSTSSGGKAGATHAGGAGNAAGATSMAGAAGAGDGECGFKSFDCTACFIDSCGAEADECSKAPDCETGVRSLAECVCDPKEDVAVCQETFLTDGGDPAAALADCFTKNCSDVCGR